MPGWSLVQVKEQDKLMGVVIPPFGTVWLFCAVAGEVEVSCNSRILMKSKYFFIFDISQQLIKKKKIKEGYNPFMGWEMIDDDYVFRGDLFKDIC